MEQPQFYSQGYLSQQYQEPYQQPYQSTGYYQQGYIPQQSRGYYPQGFMSQPPIQQMAVQQPWGSMSDLSMNPQAILAENLKLKEELKKAKGNKSMEQSLSKIVKKIDPIVINLTKYNKICGMIANVAQDYRMAEKICRTICWLF